MSDSKILFLVLGLIFTLTSISLAGDHDAGRYRYLSPLSTNIRPEDVQDLEKPEVKADREPINMKHEDPEEHEEMKEDWNPEIFAQIFSEAEKIGSQIRNSKEKGREIEREILKRRNEKERELKKLLAEIDREHRKHIVEIERQQRRIMREIEREYKKKRKD
ncbi:MAG TPA: hypothetical protein VLH08_19140 [Acidobacteriota bacterium]|nr:hypothetical protein [Acidobacteriota bacterium]